MFCSAKFAPRVSSLSSYFHQVPSPAKTGEDATSAATNGHTQKKYTSLVTQFQLDCERKSIVSLLTAIFFVGWAVGAIVNGVVSDRFGRRIAFIPSLLTIFVLGFASPFVGMTHSTCLI